MKFTVTIGSRDLEVEVLGPEVRVGGRTFPAALLRVPGTPICHLVSERSSRTYALLRHGDGWLIQHGGEGWVVEVVDERTAQLRAVKKDPGNHDAPGLVRAPMPGLVLRVEVEAGQEIAAGSGLVVLEAMKMEHDLSLPFAVKVSATHVSAGAQVAPGKLLLEFEAA